MKNLLPDYLRGEVSDGDEPPGASDKQNKRERLIPVRSTDFVWRRFHVVKLQHINVSDRASLRWFRSEYIWSQIS
jgi:hypothetical protein